MKLIKLPNGIWIDPATILCLRLVKHADLSKPDASIIVVKTANDVIDVTIPSNGQAAMDALAAQINLACDPIRRDVRS